MSTHDQTPDDTPMADIEILIELHCAPPPEGAEWITREVATQAVRILNEAIAGSLPKGVKLQIAERNPDSALKETCFILTVAPWRVVFWIADWQPLFKGDAQNLAESVDQVWSAGAPIADVIENMRTTVAARSLLTDGRGLLREALRDALMGINSGCSALKSAMEEPKNWANPVPRGVVVDGFYSLLGEGEE